jgi:mono/diheme cytochrome c family protein
MSNETLLYICGIVLALSAVTVSFIGLKVKAFPGKAMPIVVLWFAIFVVGATTFAVEHAKDEEADKAVEFQEAGQKAEEEGGNAAPEGTEGAVNGDEEKGEEEAEEGAEGFEEVGPEEGEAGAEEEAGEGGAANGEAEEAPEEEGAVGGGEAPGGEKETETPEGGAATGAATGDAEAGATVFADNCSVCHGSTGHGGNGGPDLRTMPKAKTEAGAIEQVTEGGGGMPPFGGTLSEEEIQNVAAFVVQKVVGTG